MQAEGFPEEANQTGDVLATITDAEDDMQLFWEALPAEGAGTAKTTYAFAYCDSDKARPDLSVSFPSPLLSQSSCFMLQVLEAFMPPRLILVHVC